MSLEVWLLLLMTQLLLLVLAAAVVARGLAATRRARTRTQAMWILAQMTAWVVMLPMLALVSLILLWNPTQGFWWIFPLCAAWNQYYQIATLPWEEAWGEGQARVWVGPLLV